MKKSHSAGAETPERHSEAREESAEAPKVVASSVAAGAGKKIQQEAFGGEEKANARVMVVDDDELLLATLTGALQVQGYEVVAFDDGAEAIRALRPGVDLVITDVNLPGATGPELLQAVGEKVPETRVIMMTGQADVETAVACMRAGASDFLRKPFELFELFASVRSALEMKQLARTNTLHRLGQSVMDWRDLDRLPELVLSAAREVIDCDGLALLLPGNQSTLRVAASEGELEESSPTRWSEDLQRITSLRFGAKALLLSKAPSGEQAPESSRLIFPLQGPDELFGALYFVRSSSERAISANELAQVEVFASHVVLALENAARVRRLITADRLLTIGELSASMTHEVNNALAYMVSNLSFLGEGLSVLERHTQLSSRGVEGAVAPWLEELGSDIVGELAEAARESVEGAQRVAGVIKDMRLLTRVEQESEGHFDLQSCIDSAVRLVSSTLSAHVRVDQRMSAAPQVRGNPGLITQIFVNLLLNASQAIEASKHGSTVDIVIETLDDFVQVSVIDDGPGIPPPLLDKIFEPFLTTKPAGKGTGLGLSISREIAHRHGGTLQARSELGVGTTFELCLPLQPEGRA